MKRINIKQYNNKKNTVLILMFIIGIFSVHSQTVTFEYDNSGNCVQKYKTVVLAPSFANKNSDQSDTDNVCVEAQSFELGTRTITIFPNPTKGVLKVAVTATQPDLQGVYTLTDINGKIIESNKIEQLSFIVDMTQLPKGGYFLTLIIEGKQDVWKIIKE